MTFYRPRPTLRARASAIGLSVLLVAILILALVRLGVLPPPPTREPSKSFALLPAGERAPTTRARKASKAARRVDTPAAAAPPASPPPVPVPAKVPAVALSREEFAATDIGAMAKPGAGEDESGADSVATYGPGEGPSGAQLYKAEWYRRPPANALALYLPGGPQLGWALIACRTAPGYKVENCRELDESPRGTGLARALRQAAWQFQVRPPRLGGKPLIGAWVSIRFNFTENRPG